jgi:two-component system, LytTR family, response regulator
MKIKARILIVDDDLSVINALRRIFDKSKYEVLFTTKPEDAIDILSNEIDIIICDHNMPNISGIEVLKYAKKISPNTIRILITGYSDIEIAISAINQGSIYYFFSKPWKNEEIISVVKKAIRYKYEKQEKDSVYEVLNENKRHLLEITKDLKSTQLKNIKKLPVREDEEIILINPTEISYLMAMDGNVVVNTDAGKYKSSESLSWWEGNLIENIFFRCHRSYIVNLDKIEKIIPWFNGAYNIKLKNSNENIPVSRAAMKELKLLLGF